MNKTECHELVRLIVRRWKDISLTFDQDEKIISIWETNEEDL